MFTFPVLTSPRRTGSTFRSICTVQAVLPLAYINTDPNTSQPKRYAYLPPKQDGAFVKTLKQSVIKDARLLPMTRMMIILLSGWDGAGRGNLTTNIGTIAKHLSRSRRMVFHYLKEAVQFGYLSYSRTKDRIGYYTGIKVFLNFELIRKKPISATSKNHQNQPKTSEIRDVKCTAQTKKNRYINQEIDEDLMKILARFAVRAGYLDPEDKG